MKWFEMIWNDLKWFEMRWYDMIWYDIYDMIPVERTGCTPFGGLLGEWPADYPAFPPTSAWF